jgi:hypothetical protein
VDGRVELDLGGGSNDGLLHGIFSVFFLV